MDTERCANNYNSTTYNQMVDRGIPIRGIPSKYVYGRSRSVILFKKIFIDLYSFFDTATCDLPNFPPFQTVSRRVWNTIRDH